MPTQRNFLISTTAISTTASGTTIVSGNTQSATFVVALTLVRTGIAASELASGSQTWAVHYVVSAMTTPYEMRLSLQRRNSSGTPQATIGPGTVRSATGTFDDNIVGDLGTWAANDQLALVWEHRRPSGSGNKSATIDANGSSYVDAPTPPLDLPKTATDDINNLADERGLGYGNLHADSVATLADAATIIMGHVLPFSDSVNNLADGAVKVIGTLLSPADSLQALADALVRLLSYELALADSEAANWADAHNLLLSQRLALADGFSETRLDAIILRLDQRLLFTDLLDSLTDTLAFAVNIPLDFADDTSTLADDCQPQLNYLLAVSDGGFPSTLILDDFNRADEGPPPSANWTTGIAGELGNSFPGFGFAVISNQINHGGSDVSQQFWNSQSFGPDSEAYITVANSTSLFAVGLAVRLANIGESTTEGYLARVGIPGGGTGRTYTVYKVTDGSLATLASSSESGVGSATGNKYGIRAIGDHIELWGDTGNGWEVKLDASDSEYVTAGNIGLFAEGGSSARLDDFGGGTVAARLDDNLNYALGTGPVVTEQLSDSLALTSSLGLGLGFVVADTLDQQADAISLRLDTLLSPSDLLALTDAESHTLGLQLDFSETLVLTDSLSLGHGLVATDPLPALTDFLALGYGLQISESVGLLTDAVALRSTGSLAFTDALTITDTETHVLELRLSFTETLTLTDSIALGLGLSFTESVTLTDVAVIGSDQQLQVADSIAAFTDAIALRLVHQLDLADTIVWADTCAVMLGYQQPLSDSLVTLADAGSVISGHLLSFTDAIALTDTETHTVALTLDFSDSTVLTDSVSLGYGLLVTDDTNLLSDTILTSAPQGPLRQVGVTDALDGLTDTIALELDQRVTVTDAIVLTDAAALNAGLLTTFNDTLALTDAIAADLGHLLTLADVLTLSDLAQLQLGYELIATDTVALTDSPTLSLTHYLALADNVALLADSATESVCLTLIITDNGPVFTDTIDLFSVGSLQLAETLTLTDAFTKAAAGFLSLDDSLLLADAVVLDLRGPDLDEVLADSLVLIDAIVVSLNNELQLQVTIGDILTLADHYFDLRHPYTPSVKRHVVVLSRARETVVPVREAIKVPTSDRTTRIE